jgi:membrane protein implicated in regulation of membrane protease activity
VGFVDDPEQWRWIWPVGAVAFALGEMATPGSFFLAPFALGAAVAAVLAFADVFVVVEWTAFVVVSVACLLALRRLARRLDRHGQTEGIGSRRLIGRRGRSCERSRGAPSTTPSTRGSPTPASSR